MKINATSNISVTRCIAYYSYETRILIMIPYPCDNTPIRSNTRLILKLVMFCQAIIMLYDSWQHWQQQ